MQRIACSRKGIERVFLYGRVKTSFSEHTSACNLSRYFSAKISSIRAESVQIRINTSIVQSKRSHPLTVVCKYKTNTNLQCFHLSVAHYTTFRLIYPQKRFFCSNENPNSRNTRNDWNRSKHLFYFILFIALLVIFCMFPIFLKISNKSRLN